MAENGKSTLDIPWGTLVPLVAAIAGIIAQYRPLVSERPATQGEKEVQIIAQQDVDARLWQDPLAVARKNKEAHELEKSTGNVPTEIEVSQRTQPPGRTHKDRQGQGARGKEINPVLQGEFTRATPRNAQLERHTIEALASTISDRVASAAPDRVLLLGVMLDAGPYVEQGESRLRSRQAVLQALSEAKFAPVDGEHIGFVTAAWPPEAGTGSTPDELVVPWESCEAVDRAPSVYPALYQSKTRSVFILWLPATDFNSSPFSRFATLIDWLTSKVGHDLRINVDIKLIGPSGSTGLEYMVQEARDWGRSSFLEMLHSILTSQDAYRKQIEADAARNEILRKLQVISPRASMSNEALLYRRQPGLNATGSVLTQAKHGPLTASVEKEIENGFPGLHFIRTIASDDIVLSKLVDELKLRGIDISHNSSTRDDKVVILTEWDSPYARALAMTFAALVSHQKYADLIEEPTKNWPKWIVPYRYLRGIDGRLPGEDAKSSESETNDKKSSLTSQSKPEETTEGVNQSDFLRRLATELRAEEIVWQRHGSSIRAIGLLGSDIYDKLMILRALRPAFPDAVFFTNNFDAHLERHVDWRDTHNLVIASSFGNKLPDKWSPNVAALRDYVKFAPFRDNLQTSMYAATLVAIGVMDAQDAIRLAGPRVFEIGRRGAYAFDGGGQHHWFLDWLQTGDRAKWLVYVLIWCLVVMVWLRLAIVKRTRREGVTDSLLCNTWVWLIIFVPAIVFGISWYVQRPGPDLEPLAFFSGISIWPSEMLRAIAIVLVLHFLIRAHTCLAVNEAEVAKRFCLGEYQKERWRLRSIWDVLKPIRMESVFSGDGEFSAEKAWRVYLRRNQFWARFTRVTLLSVLFCPRLLLAPLFLLFTKVSDAVPARGEAAFMFHHYLADYLTIGLTVLSFYVVDAIQLNGNLIRVFTRGLPEWPLQVLRRCSRVPPLTEKEVSRYHDVHFIAERTEAVARLIWYPLVVLALALLARSSLFDNWTWFPAMLVLYAIITTWAVGSAIFLRHAAEDLRKKALENLQLARVSSYARVSTYALEEKRRVLDELIVEIRDLKKGAFAPLRDQPFIKAILLPSGGLGLLAVALRFFEGG